MGGRPRSGVGGVSGDASAAETRQEAVELPLVLIGERDAAQIESVITGREREERSTDSYNANLRVPLPPKFGCWVC